MYGEVANPNPNHNPNPNWIIMYGEVGRMVVDPKLGVIRVVATLLWRRCVPRAP